MKKLNRLQVMKERVREAKEKLAYDNSILKELETEKIGINNSMPNFQNSLLPLKSGKKIIGR